MSGSQKRAVQSYRSRLSERGLTRFEVLGAPADRDLIRSLARRLAEDGPAAATLRTTLNRAVAADAPKKGGIVAALLASPLVGSGLDVARTFEGGREIAL